MRLLISGATGYIGTHLRKRSDQLHIDYDILSRESSCSVKQNDENVKFIGKLTLKMENCEDNKRIRTPYW